jgi:hypothetical protein
MRLLVAGQARMTLNEARSAGRPRMVVDEDVTG